MSGSGTERAEYTERLLRLESRRWKRVAGVQLPYRWNVRRLFGDREVLDLGCGTGRNLQHLAPRAVGVDHNEHSVTVCRRRGLTAFTPEEFRASPFGAPGRFTGLLAAHVVEHMTRPEATALLGAYLTYLAPGARVVIICPQERGFARDATHVEFADWAALEGIAAGTGLVVKSRFSFPLPRRLGKLFVYNEFVVVAELPPA